MGEYSVSVSPGKLPFTVGVVVLNFPFYQGKQQQFVKGSNNSLSREVTVIAVGFIDLKFYIKAIIKGCLFIVKPEAHGPQCLPEYTALA